MIDINEKLKKQGLSGRIRNLFMPRMYHFSSVDDLLSNGFKDGKCILESTRKITSPIYTLTKATLFSMPNINVEREYSIYTGDLENMPTFYHLSDLTGEISVKTLRDNKVMIFTGRNEWHEGPLQNGQRLNNPLFAILRNRSQIPFLIAYTEYKENLEAAEFNLTNFAFAH